MGHQLLTAILPSRVHLLLCQREPAPRRAPRNHDGQIVQPWYPIDPNPAMAQLLFGTLQPLDLENDCKDPVTDSRDVVGEITFRLIRCRDDYLLPSFPKGDPGRAHPASIRHA
ncbi:MAG TPA: hypothetical protein VFP86_20510 [bacterium]|nr:hypothetical protein [bacterium]